MLFASPYSYPYTYLPLKLVATALSAVGYGVVIVLSGNCLLLLQKKQRIYSNRMRLSLLIYVSVMFLFSTFAVIQSTCEMLLDFQDNLSTETLQGYWAPAMLPLTIWGADGFVVSVLFLHQNKKL